MTQFNNTDKHESNAVSLKEFILRVQKWWKLLLHHWKIIFISGIFGGAIGLTYASLKSPLYMAELSFALQGERSGGMGSALGLASQLGVDLGGGNAGGEFSGDNLLVLMKSRAMVEKALLTSVKIDDKIITLAEYYIDFNKIRKSWEDKPELSALHYPVNLDRKKFSLKQDSVLGTFHKKIILNNLTVDKVDKKLSIISVKVTSTNELFSKYFTEILAKVVSDFYVETKTKKEVKNVNILQHQTDSVRNVLNSAISGAASSVDANPNPNPTRQIIRVPSQRMTINMQTNAVVLNELVKNLEFAKMSLLQEAPLIQVIDKPILPLEKQKPGRLFSLLLGAVFFSFFTILFFTLKSLYKDILN